MVLHVLKYHDVDVDYMVGAQLQDFDTMVHLTAENEFIVLEGDEYLSSPIDRRPKFHLYQPNIALISGIAWDHINVFPTFEEYKEQFRIFADSLTHAGILVYNEQDPSVKEVVEASQHPIKKYPYGTPEHKIENGITHLDTPIGWMPLQIFGTHNLQNLAGAQWICLHMGVGEEAFYEAISSFSGASKRLEKIAENDSSVLFKDFAHAPSKVQATSKAVKKQYANRRLLACLELHTYSSLDAAFLKEYQGAMDAADTAVVFYTPEAVARKQLKAVTAQQIKDAFGRDDLIVFTDPLKLEDFLTTQSLSEVALLMMSSGNYGGFDFEAFKTNYF
jgi:UDP-N-acetylmuramate: L-alanyl-gamma-D-glutamyl-meso-diaminopimelate ligase